MCKYPCYQQATDHLIERGYIHDFVLFGNELLWIQKKIFISSDDFVILECYRFGHPAGLIEDIVVFGVLAVSANIRGILFNHYSFIDTTPQIIISKLNKMKLYSVEERFA